MTRSKLSSPPRATSTKFAGARCASRTAFASAALVSALLLAGCASAPQRGEDAPADQQARAPDRAQVGRPAAALAVSAWALASTRTGAAGTWEHFPLPGKAQSQFRPAQHEGRAALQVRADASASMVRKRVDVPPERLGGLKFSWWVHGLIDEADFSARDFDDAPVRIVLAFEGDTAKFSQRDALLSELSRTLTGEPMPYATLMYSWCPRRAVGSVVVNPRTSRIRTLVVESGPQRLGTWLQYERDVRADFEKAFGEPPGRLIGIGVMTDTDNTQSRAQAAYGPVLLLPAGLAVRSSSDPTVRR